MKAHFVHYLTFNAKVCSESEDLCQAHVANALDFIAVYSTEGGYSKARGLVTSCFGPQS